MSYRRTICGLIIIILLPPASLPAQTTRSTLPSGAGLLDQTLQVGESEVYTFDRMTTAAVGSPTIADIVPLSSRRLLVNAKGVGETTLFVYDHKGKHRMRLTVILPSPDLGPIAARVQTEIGLPGVTARVVKDTLFLEGTVINVVALQRATAIAGVYTPKLKNLIAVLPPPENAAGPTLAQTYATLLTDNLAGLGIKVQVIDDKTIALLGQYAAHFHAPEMPSTTSGVARDPKTGRFKRAVGFSNGTDASEPPTRGDPLIELKEASLKRSGDSMPIDPLDRLLQSLPSDLKVVDLINIGSHPTQQILVHAKIIDIDRNASKNLGINWGAVDAGTSRGGQSYSFLSQPLLFGQVSRSFNSSNIFTGGKLQQIFPLAAQLNALITQNKARVLSEPSLMVLDGSEGSILVGGEIPIPVAQGSSGTNGNSASVTVEYKPYGVRLLVKAALVGDNAVQMTVTPEVSDLNYGASVQISGFVVPSLTVRRATSTLQMANGETLVIGGLYSNTVSRQVQRIPLLSQIPILGEFFKNTTTRKEESELLILIQPEIVKSSTAAARPPAPGSLENPAIRRPDVRRGDFDSDFPELQKGAGDGEKPGPPVNLPLANSTQEP